MCMSNLSILANSFHGLGIMKIQNLRGNQHISILAAFVFGSAILDMRNNWFDQIFNDDYYLPLFFYFILWKGHTWENLRRNNPFLFIKHKRILISSEGFSTLEKNALICYQRQCCHASNRMWPPSADSNGSLVLFLFEFKLSVSGVTALCWQCWLSAEGRLTRP